MKTELLEDKILKLDKFFRDVSADGMPGRYGAVWPVIIRRLFYNQVEAYEYEYPYPFFDNLERICGVSIPYDLKSERRLYIKMIVDKHMSGEIDIFLYHFGMYLLYSNENRRYRQEEELSEKSIGKKRAQFIKTLPVSCFMNTDDFISAIWSYQIKKWDTELSEYRYNPSMSNVRILFSSDQFSNWTGRHYDSVDWIEPISGANDLKCKTWTQEKDPMTQEPIPEGWVEGPIILDEVNYNNNRRHYVQGVAVHASSRIQVKFGSGWITGRYEWDFDSKSLIRIHRDNEVLYIKEGHRVRVRS